MNKESGPQLSCASWKCAQPELPSMESQSRAMTQHLFATRLACHESHRRGQSCLSVAFISSSSAPEAAWSALWSQAIVSPESLPGNVQQGLYLWWVQGEPRMAVGQVIKNAKNFGAQTQYGGGAVAFQFAQVRYSDCQRGRISIADWKGSLQILKYVGHDL